MRKVISLFYFLLIVLSLNSQNFQWVRTFPMNDIADIYQTVRDSEGSTISVASFEGSGDFDPGIGVNNINSNGSKDIVFFKLDSFGLFLWAKRIGGTGSDIAPDIAVDNQNNLYITGRYSGQVDFDPGTANNFGGSTTTQPDMFIAKYDKDGNFIWKRTYSSTNVAIGTSIDVDSSGYVYVAGYFKGVLDVNPSPAVDTMLYLGSNHRIFISKFNSNGSFIWAKKFIVLSGFPISSRYGPNIHVDKAGNLYAYGSFSGTQDFDPATSTNIISSVGNMDGYISKFTKNGNLAWTKHLKSNGIVACNDLIADNSLNIHIVGHFYDSMEIVSSSTPQKLYGQGSTTGFISKIDSSGNLVWAKTSQGSINNDFSRITLDRLNNSYVAGFNQTNTIPRPAAELYKFNSSGSLLWNLSFVFTNSVNSPDLKRGSLIVDNSSNVYFEGYIVNGAVDFDPGPGSVIRHTSGINRALFLLKLNQNGLFTNINEITEQSRIDIWPNPNQGLFQVRLDNMLKDSINPNESIKIYSSTGKKVAQYPVSKLNSGTFDLSFLPSGIYLLNVSSFSKKLLIQ